ncbi:glycosyltransferase family 2 protein [Roseobacteraceae bacterium S113]
MLKVSVIIVSHGRADALARCVRAVGQLDYPAFEIVVVADSVAAAHVKGSVRKLVVFDEANISAARNLGLAQAAGDVVAFIDDDAVPEPTWLNFLTAAFANEDVMSAGGYVLGRNGVSFQWRASSADPVGRSHAATPGQPLAPGHVWRTEGTNMAFRREALLGIGGFDEAIRFFLDETDVNRRMPGACAIVPEALVHHGFAASARRREDRAPVDLYEIGASVSYFVDKHAAGAHGRLDEVTKEQRVRLLRHMVAGRLEPRDVRRLLVGLRQGFRDGTRRQSQTRDVWPAPPEFIPNDRMEGHVVLRGGGRERSALLAQARDLVAQGKRVSVFVFHRDARFLQVRFEPDGFWLHEGGQFGRGERSDRLFQRASLEARLDKEQRRVAQTRGILPE